ncbi:MAG TPA: LON peptidase substrate-binding domain-containing protein [Candidatus Polarisedimenticolia bacterium]|nr:LON peptidase substrate-binding domain-containing protein [Candidatus Polarisedimenticolia bacterium]
MTSRSDERALELLESRGRIAVFPLPGVVLFPRVFLPLHIFEPRYRKMIEDSLGADRLIAMALLKPGWEEGYHGSPEVYPIACAGVIEDEARLPDGRFNIRLRGLARVEILGFVQDSPYRVSAIRVLHDGNEQGGPGVEEEKKRLLGLCAGLLHEMSGGLERPLALDSEIPFATVVNSLCQSLAMEPEVKQGLLALDDVRLRCRGLTDILERRWQEIALLRSGDKSPTGGAVH